MRPGQAGARLTGVPRHLLPAQSTIAPRRPSPWSSPLTDTSLPDGSVLPDLASLTIMLAVSDHRRRITRLLAWLDELRTDEVAWAVFAEGGVDPATVRARVGECLRASDRQLDQLAHRLKGTRDASGGIDPNG
jgi:hypothetical protein